MPPPINTPGRDLTTGSIPRHMIFFSLPMLIGNLIQTAYSFINAVWVGKGLGKTELAAVTVSFPTVFVLMAIAIGLTMGAGILASQFVGARDTERLRRVVQSATVLVGAVSLLVVTMGEILAPWILRQMDTPPEVYALAEGYLRIVLLTMPLGFGTFLVSALLRAVGDSRTPLYFQGAGALLSAGLDPVLMFGWLGCPRLGLNGTAVANLITQSISLLAMYGYLHWSRNMTAPDWRNLRADRPMLGLILKIGLPSAIQQSLVSLSFLFVTSFVNAYGTGAMAAFGAAMRIDQLALLPAITFSMAVSTMTGQNIGAQRLERVREIFWWGVLVSGGITVAISLLAVTVPRVLLRAFLDDPEAIRMGTAYLRAVGACYGFFAVMFVSNGVINGAGHTMVTTATSLIALWLTRVPLAAWFSHELHRVEGVWYACAIGLTVGMISSVGYYATGRWKRAVVHHRVTAESVATDTLAG
jgi:putative MATE family efflux protein